MLFRSCRQIRQRRCYLPARNRWIWRLQKGKCWPLVVGNCSHPAYGFWDNETAAFCRADSVMSRCLLSPPPLWLPPMSKVAQLQLQALKHFGRVWTCPLNVTAISWKVTEQTRVKQISCILYFFLCRRKFPDTNITDCNRLDFQVKYENLLLFIVRHMKSSLFYYVH